MLRVTPGRSNQPPADGRVLSRTAMQKALARQASIEKELARYIHLVCGHLTTLQSAQKYSHWSRRGYVFCERCDNNIAVVKPRARPDYPQEPMF